MSPPPTYDNLFDYSAILSQIKDVPPSQDDSAFRWASAVGRDPMRPTNPTTPNLIVMPSVAEDNPPSLALYRVYDAAAIAAQNAALRWGNAAPTPAPNAAPAMAPSAPTPDAGLSRMPEVV